MHTCKQLASDLRTLGVKPGDTILMHSSWKSLGGLEGGAAAFFETFIDLLGAEGTLALPALSYASVCAEQPVFDVRATPVCPGVGYLPEFFRTQVPGVRRSLHPTHSCCAVGRYAELLTEDHELDDTPVGPLSPFAKLPKVGGKILMLGCHPDHNTSMHGVEETAEPIYVIDRTRRVPYILIDAQGNKLDHPAWAHNFTLDGIYYEQRYSRILDLLAEDEFVRGKVLDADCVLMDAGAVWARGHAKLLEEPLYFVDPIKL